MAITTMGVALAALAVSIAGGTASAVKANADTHKANDAKHRMQVEKEGLQAEAASIDQRARAEADAKLAERRTRSGRAASVATSPLGITDAAPISRASLAGRSLLG